jgi:hypothetical protein
MSASSQTFAHEVTNIPALIAISRCLEVSLDTANRDQCWPQTLCGTVTFMDRVTRIIMVVVGALLIASTFQKTMLMRHGRSGPWTYTVNPFGKVCLFLLGCLSIFCGLTGITELWRFSK